MDDIDTEWLLDLIQTAVEEQPSVYRVMNLGEPPEDRR